MDRVPRTSWVLWAVALFGVYLYLTKHPLYPAHRHTHAAQTGVISWPFLSAVGPDILHVLGVLALLVLLWVLALLASRLWMRQRRARAMRVDEIILGPDDTAAPFEVMSALDAIHGQLLTRYTAGAVGQVSWTFELVRDGDGGIHFLLGAPYDWLTAIEDVWRSKYTNIRFEPWSDQRRPWGVAQQITLTKHWRHATETVKDYQNSVVETLVQALDRADGAAHLQYLMTPVPAGPLHAELRSHIRSMEYQARSQQQADPANPGVGFADSQAVKDALQLYGKAAYRTEIRLGTDHWNTGQRIFGALQEANGENRFRAATVILSKNLWTRWFWDRLPSLGIFQSVLLFSFPLATLIHLPSARLRVNSLRRTLVRRGPAPRAVSRDPALSILRDETGPVGIMEADRKFNTLLVGSQGAGKTTDLLNVVWVDTHYRVAGEWSKATIVLDIGKDTAKRSLGMVPKDREVIWFDPGDNDCPWSINPLLASGDDAVLADNVLAGLTEVFGEEAIRFRSREFLGNAIMAIRDVHGDEADFTHVYRLLTDDAYRQDIIDRVQDEHQQRYWQGVFTQTMANNPRFLEEGLAAPRNKLDEVLRNPHIRATLETGHGRSLLDFREVIAKRQVVLCNLDKARLGDAGARLMGVLMLTMLWQALEAQNVVEERNRTPVSLVIDEAQNFLAEGFLAMLAEGRAYGAQTTLAVRFLGEIESEKVIKGLQALAQNLIVHQFELLDEAEVFMKRFMRVYANMVQVTAESQDAINFGADDFMRLPKYYAVCRFMANGQAQPAFLGQTLPWEDRYDAEAAEIHRAPPPGAGSSDSDALPVRPPKGRSHLRVVPPPVEAPIAPPVPAAPQPAVLAAEPPQAPDGLSSVVTLLLGKEAASRLLDSAQDDVTGLFARKIWDRAIEDATGEGYTVIFADLDGLKQVNDTQGHKAGDELLWRAGQVLKRSLRDGDIGAKYGGDELVALLHGMTPENFPPFWQRLQAAFESEQIGISLGAAMQHAGEPLPDVVKRADAAMYAVKERHRAARQQQQSAAAVPAQAAVAEASSAPAAPSSRIPSATKMPPVSSVPAHEGPDQWTADDPRAVFCDRYEMDPKRLVREANRVGVTDRELYEATRWALNNRLDQEGAWPRLRRVLEMKVEDRKILPVAQRLDSTLKETRNALVALDAKIEDASAFLDAHPQLKSLVEFKAMWTESHARQSSRR